MLTSQDASLKFASFSETETLRWLFVLRVALAHQNSDRKITSSQDAFKKAWKDHSPHIPLSW